MSDALDRALVSVRVVSQTGSSSSVFARAHRATIGKPWSFDSAEPELTGAELLLGALANDVLSLFFSLARSRRIAVDQAEATVQAELAGCLEYLGVIGATGLPHYQLFSVRAYIESPATSHELQEIWDLAVRRAPLLNTLRRSTDVDVNVVWESGDGLRGDGFRSSGLSGKTKPSGWN
jgi:OsmC-like protein